MWYFVYIYFILASVFFISSILLHLFFILLPHPLPRSTSCFCCIFKLTTYSSFFILLLHRSSSSFCCIFKLTTCSSFFILLLHLSSSSFNILLLFLFFSGSLLQFLSFSSSLLLYLSSLFLTSFPVSFFQLSLSCISLFVCAVLLKFLPLLFFPTLSLILLQQFLLSYQSRGTQTFLVFSFLSTRILFISFLFPYISINFRSHRPYFPLFSFTLHQLLSHIFSSFPLSFTHLLTSSFVFPASSHLFFVFSASSHFFLCLSRFFSPFLLLSRPFSTFPFPFSPLLNSPSFPPLLYILFISSSSTFLAFQTSSFHTSHFLPINFPCLSTSSR